MSDPGFPCTYHDWLEKKWAEWKRSVWLSGRIFARQLPCAPVLRSPRPKQKIELKEIQGNAESRK